MKTINNTFGLIFYLRKYKATNDGKAPIYAEDHFNPLRFWRIQRKIGSGSWKARRSKLYGINLVNGGFGRGRLTA